ncbi:IS110 family transposase, partial [Erwinia sp. S43]|uniref:IS110 family transposase n=1 Tax=Erwinia sp. S43 TaxID=2769339 RepID=UPI001909440A
VTRPNMRFVQVKTVDQQAVIALHTERDIIIRERVACTNNLRAMLAEFGFVMATGRTSLNQGVPEILEDAENELSPFVRASASRQMAHIDALEDQLVLIEQQLKSWAETQEACKRVTKVPGVGLLTATYVVASVGDGKQFSSAKQFSAWMGLTPREHSSGGKQRLGGISKRGDGYFRYLLVHGARAVASVIERHKEEMV